MLGLRACFAYKCALLLQWPVAALLDKSSQVQGNGNQLEQRRKPFKGGPKINDYCLFLINLKPPFSNSLLCFPELRTHIELTRTHLELISNHFVNIHLHQPQGHARARGIGGVFELQSPSDRITHTGAIKISRLDSPPNLR